MQSEPIDGELAGPLTSSVHRSAAAAAWLTDADRAGVDSALELAELVDRWRPVLDPAELAMIVGRLIRALDRLGLTPAGREPISTETEDHGETIAQLRAIAGGRKR